jgi:hypothetical protein
VSAALQMRSLEKAFSDLEVAKARAEAVYKRVLER